MGFILGIVAVLIGLVVLVKMLSLIGKLLKLAAGLTVLGIFGLPVGYGLAVAALFKRPALRKTVNSMSAFILLVCSVGWVVLDWHPFYNAGSLNAGKFVLPALLALVMLGVHSTSTRSHSGNQAQDWIKQNDKKFHQCFQSAFALLLISAAIPSLFATLGWPGQEIAAWGYWTVALFTQIYCISFDQARRNLEAKLVPLLQIQDHQRIDTLIKELATESLLDTADVQILLDGRLSARVEAGELYEIQVADERWAFPAHWYLARFQALHTTLSQQVRYDSTQLAHWVQNAFSLEGNAAKAFTEQHMTFGQYRDYNDGRYWSAYTHASKISCCTACGIAQLRDSANDTEWFCSDICKQTEKACMEIRQKLEVEFIAEAATSGFILMAGASAWNDNHKLFATGGQGHGFAAERANNRVDRSLGRDAKILGDDNAINGADRQVNGQLIQTKYCATGARSIGAAFDGQHGQYKYLDSQNQPMQIEVPKDQYEDAVRTLQKKISEGKVPGVSDSSEAVGLIRKGHLTYAQARNIIKFGTFESIAYDISEGVVVGTVAGGISFGISASLFYLKTGNRDEALQVAVIQAGKSFGRSLTVYVAAQQLHRLQLIQKSLNLVDVSHLAPSTRELLSKGMGVSKSGLNKALRGTLITSIAVIAVTTGPDLLKLARGRISNAQFMKNLTVASSGVAGGTIGSITGGVLAAPLGPVGAFVGRAAGGMVGGIIAAAVSNKLMGKLVQEDRELIISIIQTQLEYLAVAFVLAEEELSSVSANLDKALTQKTLETIFAAKSNRRAMANLYLKPVVVAVVRQRPAVEYSPQEVVEAAEAMVA